MVGGNDFSKGNGDETSGGEKGINVPLVGGGGGGPDNAFNNLVIPSSSAKMNGDNGPKETGNKEKTIMGGLADFGSLVINKIM